ncbi:hypothetical protein ACLKA6_010707 [Drosophila palustris]
MDTESWQQSMELELELEQFPAAQLACHMWPITCIHFNWLRSLVPITDFGYFIFQATSNVISFRCLPPCDL